MTGTETVVNGVGNGPVSGRLTAPLKNVRAFNELISRVMNRSAHLPGMATFYGFSGFGKTWSATFAANRTGARYVEVGASWTKKKLLQSIAREIGVQPEKVIADMMDQVIEAMAIDGLPLIIDEADYLCQKGMINLVREIHDKSHAPVILIGEENLPNNLRKWERVHNRMLDWLPAQPADLADVHALAKLYAPGISIADDLLQDIAEKSGGRVRRAAVNIERVREAAENQGLESIDRRTYSGELFTGAPPKRRV